jgi:ribosomal protein L7Ae-like RNA K-turn-binding protein
MLARLLSGLGLARKAGELTFGFEKVLAVIEAGRVAALVEATDGAEDGRRRLWSTARRRSPAASLIGLFASAEMGLALGAENVIHTAFLAGRGADRWISDVRRLSGFRPLFPEGWREDS